MPFGSRYPSRIWVIALWTASLTESVDLACDRMLLVFRMPVRFSPDAVPVHDLRLEPELEAVRGAGCRSASGADRRPPGPCAWQGSSGRCVLTDSVTFAKSIVASGFVPVETAVASAVSAATFVNAP